MKVVFLGTPDFAVATLKALSQSRHDVVAVVSQPDRAKDRKGRLLPTPVKVYANEAGIALYQFEKIRTEGVDVLKELAPDVMVTAAYGQILSKEILDIAPYGVVNVHASLLPKLRGSAPIQWAVINGEKETGITVMQTDVGIDDGDILAVERTPIGGQETAGELADRLSIMGAKLLIDTLDKLEKGEIVPLKQNENEATKCRMLVKSDGHLDFSETKEKIVRRCLGVTPAPGAYAVLNGEILKIGKVRAVDDRHCDCGISAVIDKNIVVGCADGGIVLERLQLPGGKMMSAEEFLRGRKWKDGIRLE